VVGSLLLALALLAGHPDTATIAEADTLPRTAEVGGIVIGGVEEDRLRLRQIHGRSPASGFLLRSTHAPLPLTPDRGPGEISWKPLPARVRVAHNPGGPRSLNEGALWGGRGMNVLASGGVAGSWGPAHLVLAPEIAWQENRDFDHPTALVPSRTRFSPPWRVGHQSADLPVRFGDRSYAVLGLGQSRIGVEAGPVAVGLSNEHRWWGPGIRNAILLSNNAPGFPHLFVQPVSGIDTRVGEIDASYLLGALSPSVLSAAPRGNNLRSFNAVGVTFRPVVEPNLTLGVARAVYASAGGGAALPQHALDALLRWGTGDAEAGVPTEQLLSLFARWLFPAAGAEAYVEWTRADLPGSIRELLADPQRSQGYTVGLQWASGTGEEGAALRLQTELTNLEQDGSWRADGPASFYVSPVVTDGYTNRGRVVGAAIGPGASSQWLAFDVLSPGWSAGAFLERIRWDNDAYYTQPVGRAYFAHDVSVTAGARGSVMTSVGAFDLELAREHRHNFLFQNPSYFFGDDLATDVIQLLVRMEYRFTVPGGSAGASHAPPPPAPAPTAAPDASSPRAGVQAP